MGPLFGSAAMETRLRIRQIDTLKDRLAQQAENLRKQAEGMPAAGYVETSSLRKLGRPRGPLASTSGFHPQAFSRRGRSTNPAALTWGERLGAVRSGQHDAPARGV